MTDPSSAPQSLLVTCAVCERLHPPELPSASNPICGECVHERLPAGHLPRWTRAARPRPNQT